MLAAQCPCRPLARQAGVGCTYLWRRPPVVAMCGLGHAPTAVLECSVFRTRVQGEAREVLSFPLVPNS
jgi:hypothetical protein